MDLSTKDLLLLKELLKHFIWNGRPSELFEWKTSAVAMDYLGTLYNPKDLQDPYHTTS